MGNDLIKIIVEVIGSCGNKEKLVLAYGQIFFLFFSKLCESNCSSKDTSFYL